LAGSLPGRTIRNVNVPHVSADSDPRPSPATQPDVAGTQLPQTVAPTRRRGRRLVRRIALWAVSVLVALIVVATGLVVWSVRRAFPDLSGQLTLPGLSAPVTVYRDGYGIPQVYARSSADLFRAQGYLHAQDRFWEMDFRRHVTSGRLAELFGADQVPTDAFLRTLGWRGVAEQELPLLSPQTRTILQDYAEGVNAWLDANGGAAPSGVKSLEYSVLGLANGGYTVQPWSPIDSLAWLKAMAWDLKGNYDSEIGRAVLFAHGLTRAQVSQLYPTYPHHQNRPIVDGGAVVNGAFDAKATPAPPSAGAPTDAPASVWHDAAGTLSDLSAALDQLPKLIGNGDDGIGSNSWVIGGSLTTTGKPLLGNDPHLSPSMPGIWYQMGLHCDCEFNVEGFTFSGVPGVVIGHNERIAWGFTNLNPDVTDLYLERVDGERVLNGSTWTEVQQRDEVIKVAGGDPVTVTVRSTRHGPLLSDRSRDLLTMARTPTVDASGSPLASVSQRPAAAPTASLDPAASGVPVAAAKAPYAVALRWTALDPGRTADSIFLLNKASNWSDFRAAAALFEVPAQNLIYADVAGNIGYQSPGKVPVRGHGDGTWPAPGWDPSYDWMGYLPFAELPTVYNPDDGWIVTANQAVVGPGYPHLLTHDWSYGYRSQRIMDLIRARTATGKVSAEDIRAMQFDNRNSFAQTLVPVIRRVNPAGPVHLFDNWDFQQGESSAPAALYNAFWRHLLTRTFDELPAQRPPNGNDRWWEVVRPLLDQPNSPWWDDRSTPAVESLNDTFAAAMTDAVAELTARLGADPAAWRWGDLHTLELTNATFGKSGIDPIEWLFNRGPKGTSGGGAIVNATGWNAAEGYQVNAVPSMRMIVDMSNLDASRWVQLTGNSGHAFHPNYDDQFELWRTGENLSMPWTRSTIEAQARNTLTLNP
jgi:penicillin amidase